MRVVSFVTQKGGSGKTTLAFCCAVAAEQAGEKVLIVDVDPQGTAENWYQDRELDTPRLVSINSTELEQALSSAKENGFDVALIDTAGRDEPSKVSWTWTLPLLLNHKELYCEVIWVRLFTMRVMKNTDLRNWAWQNGWIRGIPRPGYIRPF